MTSRFSQLAALQASKMRRVVKRRAGEAPSHDRVRMTRASRWVYNPPVDDIWRAYVEQTASMAPDDVVAEVLDAAIEQREVRKALDLGCGGGRHLELFASRGIEPIGLDSSAACSRVNRHEVLPGDLTRPLPLADASVDFVLLWGVFVHLPPASHLQLFEQVRRVLRPDATFLVDILRPDDFRNALGHPMAPNYNESPFIQGVTDFFCTERYLQAIASSFDVLMVRDLSTERRGQRVSQGCFWLRR